jgi:septum formation protein
VTILVLASASAARAAMLAAAGVVAETMPARIDEAAVRAAMLAEGASPRDLAARLAELKALRISARAPGRLVLGADQVLVLDGQVFDKAASRAEARAQLLALRGRRHQLLSAAVVALNGAPVWRHVGTARLTMRRFSESFLDNYLERLGDLALASVGCYHLEGLGAQLFSRVEGDHFTVLGLPLLELLGYLRARGVLPE